MASFLQHLRDAFAEELKVNPQFLDDQVAVKWKDWHGKEVKRWNDPKRIRAMSADAHAQKDQKTQLGHLVAEMDMTEYLNLCKQYGRETVMSRDFLMKYRKYRDQQFLPTPSKAIA